MGTSESPVTPLRAATSIASTGARNKNTIKYKVLPRVQGGIGSFSARYFGVLRYGVPRGRRESDTGYGVKRVFYCRFVVRVIFTRCRERAIEIGADKKSLFSREIRG